MCKDVVDAYGKDVDLDFLRPVGRLGGIRCVRVTDTFELARSSWASAMKRAGPQLEELMRSSEAIGKGHLAGP